GVQQGHDGDRRSDGREPSADRRRWRRLDRGALPLRPERRHHSHLNRRRRLARVPRGARAPRFGGAGAMKKPTGRRPMLAGNWKMHSTRAEATALIDGIKEAAASARDRDVVVAPPFTALETAARAIAGTSIGLAAQDLHAEPKGAFTGEVG